MPRSDQRRRNGACKKNNHLTITSPSRLGAERPWDAVRPLFPSTAITRATHSGAFEEPTIALAAPTMTKHLGRGPAFSDVYLAVKGPVA